jgi:hypothetical protein
MNINYYKHINKTELNKWINIIMSIRDLKAFLIQPLTNRNLNFEIIDDKKVKWYGHYRISTHCMKVNLDGHLNLGQLIDTIAHELAHIDLIEHGKEHTHKKMLYKKLIKICINEERMAA